MKNARLRCAESWNGRFRCSRPDCDRCRRRQILRECRAVMNRLDAPECQFVPVTIRLGFVEDIIETIAEFRSDLRNRLNLCRHASRRWADVVIWGWFAVRKICSGQYEISAYAIVRIGALLGTADAHDALVRTWSHPGQIEVGAAVSQDNLLTLAKGIIGNVFTHDSQFFGLPGFRSLRFRYGRTRPSTPTARKKLVFHEPMPILF